MKRKTFYFCVAALTFLFGITLVLILTDEPKPVVEIVIPNLTEPAVLANTPKTIYSQQNSPVKPRHSSPITFSKNGDNLGVKLGIVDIKDNSIICLTTQNSTLENGNKIQVILTEFPQQILQAEVSEKLDVNCSLADKIGNGSATTSYSLKLSENDVSNLGFAIAIIDSPNKVKINKGLANIDLDSDGKNEYFRECYGFESLHLFVLKGIPSSGKSVWHSYYHFNYGTERTCKNKEFEAIIK